MAIAIGQPCKHGHIPPRPHPLPFPSAAYLDGLFGGCNHSYRIALSVNCYIFKACPARGEAE